MWGQIKRQYKKYTYLRNKYWNNIDVPCTFYIVLCALLSVDDAFEI